MHQILITSVPAIIVKARELKLNSNPSLVGEDGHYQSHMRWSHFADSQPVAHLPTYRLAESVLFKADHGHRVQRSILLITNMILIVIIP